MCLLAPLSAHSQAIKITVTAYTPHNAENGGHKPTAVGAPLNTEIVAAVSPDLEQGSDPKSGSLPMRTIVKIVGPEKPQRGCEFKDPGYRVVLDRTASRLSKTIDVLLPTQGSAFSFGRCLQVTIEVVGYLPEGQKIPTNQAELAMLVDEGSPVEVAEASDVPLPK